MPASKDAQDSLSVACVGEAMLELQLSTIPGPAQLTVAGDVLNTAIYLRRQLPRPHRVKFVTVLGKDPHSESIKEFARTEGVEVDSIAQIEDRLPGLYAIAVDEQGERSFTYWRSQSAARSLFQTEHDLNFETLADVDVLYLSAITLAIIPQTTRKALFDWIASFRQGGGIFVFDSNYRPRLWESVAAARDSISSAWGLCDIALPSVDDEMELFGDVDDKAVLKRFGAYGKCRGALKRGRLGPVSINDRPKSLPKFHPLENVVDSTAAGDSFNGGYLAAILQGHDLAEALSFGHELASQVVQHKGGIVEAEKLR